MDKKENLMDFQKSLIEAMTKNFDQTLNKIPESTAKNTDPKPDTVIEDLRKQIETLTAQINKPEPPKEIPAEDKIKNLSNGIADLIKAAGYDPNTVKFDFTIKEDKRGQVDSDDNLGNKINSDPELDLNKELDSLEPEDKKKALDAWLKTKIVG